MQRVQCLSCGLWTSTPLVWFGQFQMCISCAQVSTSRGVPPPRYKFSPDECYLCRKTTPKTTQPLEPFEVDLDELAKLF